MVKHGARRHQIKVARLDRPGDDVSLAKLEVRRDLRRQATDRDPPPRPARPDAIRSASHAEMEPFPHPTSSVRAPGPMPSGSM